MQYCSSFHSLVIFCAFAGEGHWLQLISPGFPILPMDTFSTQLPINLSKASVPYYNPASETFKHCDHQHRT